MTFATYLLLAVATASTAPSTAPSTGPATQPSTRGAADTSAEYIEYRVQPELGTITIYNGSVRGEACVKRLHEHAEELTKAGIFPACTEKTERHIYRRSERLAGRKIDTLILLQGPTGDADDENGKYGTQHVVVRVDGKRKIDCTLGTSADGELWVSQITLFPEDGTLEVRALTADGEELALPEEWESLDDPTVITDDSFYEDAPDEGGNKPLKT